MSDQARAAMIHAAAKARHSLACDGGFTYIGIVAAEAAVDAIRPLIATDTAAAVTAALRDAADRCEETAEDTLMLPDQKLVCPALARRILALITPSGTAALDAAIARAVAEKNAEIARLRVGRRIYLDLDGVMADFDAHFPATFGADHRSMADDAMWASINAHPSYFRDMPPCPGAVAFWAEIAHLNPIILTACPRTNYTHVAQQKKAWVAHHLSPDATVLPVMGGHNKWLFMHAPGDVLIDDYAKNIKPWSEAGGFGILHRSFDETRAALALPPEGGAL